MDTEEVIQVTCPITPVQLLKLSVKVRDTRHECRELESFGHKSPE